MRLIRHYIFWLETSADPAGTIRRNFWLELENAGLRELLAELAPARLSEAEICVRCFCELEHEQVGICSECVRLENAN